MSEIIYSPSRDVYYSFKLQEKIKEFNMVVAGVGGQGVLTFLGIITEAILKEGYDVKSTELHGLAQRYGPLLSFVKFGDKIYSPTVLEGNADLIVCLEPLESLKASVYGSKDKTIFIIDTYPIIPISTYIENKKYPEIEEIKDFLSYYAKKIYLVNASEIAKKETGDRVLSNVYFLGYIVGKNLIPISKEKMIETIKENVRKRFVEINIKMFEKGYKDAINFKNY